jgi:hypothetical protein
MQTLDPLRLPEQADCDHDENVDVTTLNSFQPRKTGAAAWLLMKMLLRLAQCRDCRFKYTGWQSSFIVFCFVRLHEVVAANKQSGLPKFL